MKLTWERCSCGNPFCKLSTPKEIGSFYQGSGFAPKEQAIMDKAFASITMKQFLAIKATAHD